MPEKKKWKKEISAGGVVYKIDNGQAWILLINPKSRDFGPPEDYWTFPKGKQDKEGEDLQQVAVRETREEGGVDAVVEAELGYIKYFRNWPGMEAFKLVHFFLMKYVSGDPKDHDEEIADAGWFPLAEAENKLKFDTDKEIYTKAKNILDSKL